jgi:hypothetical protein
MDAEELTIWQRLLAGLELAGRILVWLILFPPIAIWCALVVLAGEAAKFVNGRSNPRLG